MLHITVAVAAALTAAGAAGTAESASYKIDIGDARDELFIGSNWEPSEGPYAIYGPVWRSRCRWARQGATVRVPVFPGRRNTFEIRGDMGSEETQRLRVFLNSAPVAVLPPRDSLIYDFEVGPDLIGDDGWAEFRLETELPAPRSPGDFRDLRMAVDWIRVSADAPARDYLSEALVDTGLDLGRIERDKAPRRWMFRYDPNNSGDTHSVRKWSGMTYDDSAFEIVDTSYVPQMMRGDAAWFRAWVDISDEPDRVHAEFELPAEGMETDGRRRVWVNGLEVKAEPGASLRDGAAAALMQGPNLIVVKAMKGPLPRPAGDDFVDQPVYEGRFARGNVGVRVGRVVLKTGFESARRLKVCLLDPSGQRIGSETRDVSDLGEGRRGIDCRSIWTFRRFGEHSVVVEDESGRRRAFPVHFLGVHFFHWGWYSAYEGTTWNGFNPASNDYLDQLFAMLDDWPKPHHSISWGGVILEPGTGFHKTQGADYIGKHREAIAQGRLGFVGMPFPPRNVCTDFGESLLRSVRRSLKLYESELRVRPTVFLGHDATLTPMLPQILQLCGYDSCLLLDNWWGMDSIPGSRDCIWRMDDGTAVRTLASWYHGISASAQARRAVEQGKPAVLCNEEFACLDATVSLTREEAVKLAAEGIFLKPIPLDEYQRVSEEFARELVYQDDHGLRYKGWTGGSEGEQEYEKANRILETRLVALESFAAFARWLGIEADQGRIDEWWNNSMRWHECHNHWGNGYPQLTEWMRNGARFADEEMLRLGGLIAQRVSCESDGAIVFNPLGFERPGLVRLTAPAGARSLTFGGRGWALQPDPDEDGVSAAWLPDLPSIGYRHYDYSDLPANEPGVTVREQDECAVLDNGAIRVRVAEDGSIEIEDTSGETLAAGANRLYFALPGEQAPDEPLSTQTNQLNLAHYCRPEPVGPVRVICSGPVVAAAECHLAVRQYPGVRITLRVSLAGDERMARVRLAMSFPEPTLVWPRGGQHAHEGTYLPGVFAAFDFPESAEPVADMAYCTTGSPLRATNHQTFLNVPFRNCTYNALSLSGPSTGEYWVLTRGLPDFFAVRRPAPFMALSFGFGADNYAHFKGEYVHEYAVFAPSPDDREGSDVPAYLNAQAFLVEPFATAHGPTTGDLPLQASFASAHGRSVMIPGAQVEDGNLLVRLLNLSRSSESVRLGGLAWLEGTGVFADGSAHEDLTLGPRSLREVRTRLP